MIKGASEKILNMCTSIFYNNKLVPITPVKIFSKYYNNKRLLEIFYLKGDLSSIRTTKYKTC